MSKERLEIIKKLRETILEENDFRTRCVLAYVFVNLGYMEWLIEQAERVEELEKDKNEYIRWWKDEARLGNELRDENQRYKQALEYIQRAIYTQHCTKNHKWNSEFEKGQISGLIQASNIVDKAIRKVEGEV